MDPLRITRAVPAIRSPLVIRYPAAVEPKQHTAALVEFIDSVPTVLDFCHVVQPEGVQGNRTQGIGVQFTQDETGANARATIERILGESLASTRSTHTM